MIEFKLDQETYKIAREEPAFGLFKHNGYVCLIKRGPISWNWLGYVGIPKHHAYYGREHSSWDIDKDASDIECHYGLTYSGKMRINEFLEEDYWWFGFDTDHLDDLPLITSFGNEGVYRTYEFVKENVISIADQLHNREVEGDD